MCLTHLYPVPTKQVTSPRLGSGVIIVTRMEKVTPLMELVSWQEKEEDTQVRKNINRKQNQATLPQHRIMLQDRDGAASA